MINSFYTLLCFWDVFMTVFSSKKHYISYIVVKRCFHKQPRSKWKMEIVLNVAVGALNFALFRKTFFYLLLNFIFTQSKFLHLLIESQFLDICRSIIELNFIFVKIKYFQASWELNSLHLWCIKTKRSLKNKINYAKSLIWT